MRIDLLGIGKRFKKDWIFKNIDYQFKAYSKTAIIGPNGSGKSTLLKIISAAELPTLGQLDYHAAADKKIELEKAYSYISYAAPYMELPEKLELNELFRFHQSMKNFRNNIDLDAFLQITELETAGKKQIYHFSSGMKQRLKLGLAILSDTPILILDEPCSNLDASGVELYRKLMKEHAKERTIIIGSNQNQDEMLGAEDKINILSYK